MHPSCRIFRTAVALPFAALIALLSLVITPPAHAQVCPFDDGNSTLTVDGLILTRYALGITGPPLVAGTGIFAVDAPSVEATINCPSCGLNITGNPTMTVADATIISRKLAGFSGAALTNGLSLGSGTRNTPAAVNSFLLGGCGTTGGTVTSVTAGTGLTGGTISTSGTIAADTTFLQRRVSSTCSAGSFITAVAADGTVSCGTPPAGGTGTVTNITTGSGLSGGPITATGTINLTATQLLPTVACSTDQIAKWSGTAWVCAAVSSLAPAPTQLKPQTLRRSNIDGAANTGQYSSTTIGVDGFPVIAYYDQGNQNLKIAHCDNIQCSTSTAVLLDSTGDVGKFPSIAIAPGGLAVISYYDQTNGALKVAFCADIACSSASIATVDSNNNVGQYTSIAVAANGSLAISYYDATTFDLKLAVCNSATCVSSSTYNFFTVDSVGDVGKWSAIAFGNTNTTGFSERIVIGYFDNTNKTVKLAFCGGFSCASPTFAVVETLGTDSADGISMVLGENNAPLLSYYKRSSATAALARIAVCDTPACAVPVLRSGGSGNFHEQLSSITVGSDGLPIAAFGAATADCDASAGGTIPRVIRCLDATCASLSASFTGSLFAQSPSMTIGIDGVPFISGQRCATGGSTISTLHCSDASCAAGYRRR